MVEIGQKELTELALMKYQEWFKDNWSAAGGLITQSTAAKYMNVTRSRVAQMIREKKLTPYKFENDVPFVSFTEVVKFMNKRKSKQNEDK